MNQRTCWSCPRFLNGFKSIFVWMIYYQGLPNFVIFGILMPCEALLTSWVGNAKQWQVKIGTRLHSQHQRLAKLCWGAPRKDDLGAISSTSSTQIYGCVPNSPPSVQQSQTTEDVSPQPKDKKYHCSIDNHQKTGGSEAVQRSLCQPWPIDFIGFSIPLFTNKPAELSGDLGCEDEVPKDSVVYQ